MRNEFERNYRSLKKTDDFHRAEIKLNKLELPYQLKLNALNANEACFLIKDDSTLFNKLEVGNVLEMKYYLGLGKLLKPSLWQMKVRPMYILC